MTQATAPVSYEQLAIAEQNLAQIEQALAAEPQPTGWARGVEFHFLGIWVTWDSVDNVVLRAHVDGAEDFIDAHGLPCTHARARQIADGWAKVGTREFDAKLEEAIAEENAKARDEDRISQAEDY